MIQKINKCLPKKYEDDIENAVTVVPYFFHPNTSYSPRDEFYDQWMNSSNLNIVDNGQFVHSVFNEGLVDSQLYGLLYPILYVFAEKAEIEVNEILRIKVNLLLRDKTFNNHEYNFPHTDSGIGADKAFLYYINDCDGDTVFFDKFGKDVDFPNDLEIMNRVSPNKGSGVFFDADRFHASCNPTKSLYRYVINFNFK